MRSRLLAILVLTATGFVLAAPPTSAQKPIPGIKQTVAFKQMKNYVQLLFSKRNQPVLAARRQTYRTNLTTRRTAANQKVNALFQQKVNRIRKQDDNQERRQIKQIRVNQKNQVQGLKQDLAERLAELQADQNAAVQRVFDRFAPQINSRANQRDSLKRQLNRTRNPARRARLTRQINTLQVQINGLVSDRTTSVNNVNTRYSARASSVNSLFNSRIANAKASAQQQIQQARNAWKQTFRTQFAAAKTRRSAQAEVVGTVAARGFGYIAQMPPADQ